MRTAGFNLLKKVQARKAVMMMSLERGTAES